MHVEDRRAPALMELDSSAAAADGGVDEIVVVATEHPEAAAAAATIAGTSSVEPAAAKEESKVEVPPAAAMVEVPKLKVVAVKAEKVPDDYIQRLLKKPPRRLTLPPESFFEKYPRLRELTINTHRDINLFVDVKEDILRQYRKKGYAVVGVEHIDNGLKRMFILPEESTVLPEESTTA